METEIKIKIKTKFNKIVEADENGFPTTVDITQQEEERFHKFVKEVIKEVLEKDEFDDHYVDRFIEDFGVEGWDCFDDYGEIKMEIEE